MNLISFFREFRNDESKGQSYSLPLVFTLFLPFYQIPGADQAIRIAQMQIFQVLTILVFIFQRTSIRSSFWHPFRWLVYLSIFQLFMFDMNTRLAFHVQMISISYLFFEVCVGSNLKLKHIRFLFLFFLLVTVLYALKQYLNVGGFLPDYLCLDRSKLGQKIMFVSGIWTVQAFCATFLALCIVCLYTFKTNLKWILIAIASVVLYKTDSAFGFGGALIGVSYISFIKNPRKAFMFSMIGLFLFLSWYFAFGMGDGSSESSRFFIWKATVKAILNSPFIGYSFGSFLPFGAQTCWLGKLQPLGSFYGQAHNELMQLWFEGGILGLLIGLGFIGRVFFYGIKYRANEEILSYSAILITFIAISMGQPILHIMHLSMIFMLILGVFEGKLERISHAD